MFEPRFASFYWVFIVFVGFEKVLLSLIGSYLVSLGCTKFDWVLLGFTGFYKVLLGFNWVSFVPLSAPVQIDTPSFKDRNFFLNQKYKSTNQIKSSHNIPDSQQDPIKETFVVSSNISGSVTWIVPC